MAAVRKRRAGRVAESAVVDVAAGAAAATDLCCGEERGVLRVGLAAGVVLAAGARAIGFVDEDVIVAGSADDSVDRFGKLFVAGGRRVVGTALFARNGHSVLLCAARASSLATR